MSYYAKIVDETVDTLKFYGITHSILDEYNMDLWSFMKSYDVYDDFVKNNNLSESYENFFDLIQENVSNSVDFTDSDFNDMIRDAIKYCGGYSSFAECLSSDGWNPVEKRIIPTTEDEFYEKLEIDSEFNTEVWGSIRDALLYDWPNFGIETFQGRDDMIFWDDVESKLN